jgi:hypothetical protein
MTPMTHDEAVLLLTDLLAGRLAPDLRHQVQGHLEGCEDCASLAGTHDMLAGRHTPVEDLVDLSLHPDEMEGARRMQLQAHLDVCEACGAESRFVRSAERSAVATMTGGRPREAWMLPLVAAVALLGLGFSAWLALFRIPRLESTIDRLEASPPRRIDAAPHPNEAGPLVRVQYLPSARRGPGSHAIVDLEPGQPYEYLAVEIPNLEPRGDYAVDLAAGNGDRVWSRPIGADDLRRLTKGTPEITLAVPTRVLHAGGFVLRLRDAASPADPPLLEIPFEVRPAP